MRELAKGIWLEKLLDYEEYYKHRIYEPKMCKHNAPIVICSEDDKTI